MILDRVADVVRTVLGVLPDDAAHFLFLPAFIAVVVTGVILLVRKAASPLFRLGAEVLTWVITGVGAVALLAEMVVAGGYRQSGTRPPTAVYNLGDAVASWVVGLSAGVRRASTAIGNALSRAKVPVLVLLSAGWIWLWNYQACPDSAPGCDRPVTIWYRQVSDNPK